MVVTKGLKFINKFMINFTKKKEQSVVMKIVYSKL